MEIKVPVGWKVEEECCGTVISCPDGGMVTVDFKRRIFAFGCGYVTRPDNKKTYNGRGWQQSLVDDAVNLLKEALEL